MNLTPGGLLGYCSSKCITRRKVPSSNGVSEGPMMTAFLCWISIYQENRRCGVCWYCDQRLLPCHDIVGNRRCRNACRRVRLHSLYLDISLQKAFKYRHEAISAVKALVNSIKERESHCFLESAFRNRSQHTYLEIPHQPTPRRSRHFVFSCNFVISSR